MSVCDDRKWMLGWLGAYGIAAVLAIAVNAALLVGGIWLAVKMLRWMGVL